MRRIRIRSRIRAKPYPYSKKKKVLQSQEKKAVEKVIELSSPEDFLSVLHNFFEKSKDEKKIESFSITIAKNLITATVVFNKDFVVNFCIILFPQHSEKGLYKGTESSRQISLLVNNKVSKKVLEEKLSNFIKARDLGIKAEDRMFLILENIQEKYPKIFKNLRKATTEEDMYLHSDFFITCRITNKKSIEIPIDCKNSEAGKKDSQEKFGNNLFFLSLAKVEKILKESKGEESLKNYLLKTARKINKHKALS